MRINKLSIVAGIAVAVVSTAGISLAQTGSEPEVVKEPSAPALYAEPTPEAPSDPQPTETAPAPEVTPPNEGNTDQPATGSEPAPVDPTPTEPAPTPTPEPTPTPAPVIIDPMTITSVTEELGNHNLKTCRYTLQDGTSEVVIHSQDKNCLTVGSIFNRYY